MFYIKKAARTLSSSLKNIEGKKQKIEKKTKINKYKSSTRRFQIFRRPVVGILRCIIVVDRTFIPTIDNPCVLAGIITVIKQK